MTCTLSRLRALLLASPLLAAVALQGQTAPPPDGAVTELEKFILTESALAKAGDTLPTSRPFYSVFGNQSALDVPRSVTVLTPELLKRLGIEDFADLVKVGAGTQQINFYGVPGAPSLRGAKGSVFFNGIQRAYQRNEMPLSFGSLDAMDVVKGPAPSHFGASLAGGYVNLIPKSPYFDRTRGSLTTEIGQYDHYRAQFDIGGPLLIAGKPAAYRISLTGQLSDSYYDRVGNDFVSLYGSIKARVAEGISVFTGGEYFNFKSNENAGWNRPTQNLLDSGRYVIGEPLSIVSNAWGGTADRSLIYKNSALVVPSSIVDAALSSGQITPTQRSAMLNLSDPTQRAQAYVNFTPAQLAGISPSTSGYQYTPAYFAAGGKAFTREIGGDTVLSDDRDHADSQNFLYFFDVENARNPSAILKGQFLLDFIGTDKLSTYGYAIETDQLVLETKATAVQQFDFLGGMNLTYGLSGRYTDAKMLQDFLDEPFSRRDITNAEISRNSVILTGPQRGPDGKNFWSPTAQGGANAHSKLWQFSAFAYSENKLGEKFTAYTSLLLTHAPYTTEYPSQVDLVGPTDPRRNKVSDEKTYSSGSVSVVYAATSTVKVYGTFQHGTALDPLQGGAIVGKGNFSRNQLIEAGLKTSLLDDTLFTSLSGYKWKQTAFDERTNTAEPLAGAGAEFELTYAPIPSFSLIASVGHQRVTREIPLSAFRPMPRDEQGWALTGGVLPGEFNPSPTSEVRRPSRNTDLVYPGTPETQAKLFVLFAHRSGLGFSGGPVWSDAYWHNFDHTLRLPATTVWHASVFFRKARYEIALSGENLTDEDHFSGADPVFAANTVITKAPGKNGKLTFTLKF